MSSTCSLSFPKHENQINCFFSRRSNRECRDLPLLGKLMLSLPHHQLSKEERRGGDKHLSPVGSLEALSKDMLPQT